jgi:hypothetical protein
MFILHIKSAGNVPVLSGGDVPAVQYMHKLQSCPCNKWWNVSVVSAEVE